MKIASISVAIFAFVTLQGMEQGILSSIDQDLLITSAYSLQQETGVILNLAEMICSNDITIKKALNMAHEPVECQKKFMDVYDCSVNKLKKEYLTCAQYTIPGKVRCIATLKKKNGPFIVTTLVKSGLIFTKEEFVFTKYQYKLTDHTIQTEEMGRQPDVRFSRFYYYPSALCLFAGPDRGTLSIAHEKGFISSVVRPHATHQEVEEEYKKSVSEKFGADVTHEAPCPPSLFLSYKHKAPLHTEWLHERHNNVPSSIEKLMIVTYEDMEKDALYGSPQQNVWNDLGTVITAASRTKNNQQAINDQGIIAYSSDTTLTFLRPKYPILLLKHYASLPFLQKFLLAYYLIQKSTNDDSVAD